MRKTTTMGIIRHLFKLQAEFVVVALEGDGEDDSVIFPTVSEKEEVRQQVLVMVRFKFNSRLKPHTRHNPVSENFAWDHKGKSWAIGRLRTSLRGCCNTTIALAGLTVPFETLQANGDVTGFIDTRRYCPGVPLSCPFLYELLLLPGFQSRGGGIYRLAFFPLRRKFLGWRLLFLKPWDYTAANVELHVYAKTRNLHSQSNIRCKKRRYLYCGQKLVLLTLCILL